MLIPLPSPRPRFPAMVRQSFTECSRNGWTSIPDQGSLGWPPALDFGNDPSILALLGCLMLRIDVSATYRSRDCLMRGLSVCKFIWKYFGSGRSRTAEKIVCAKLSSSHIVPSHPINPNPDPIILPPHRLRTHKITVGNHEKYLAGIPTTRRCEMWLVQLFTTRGSQVKKTLHNRDWVHDRGFALSVAQSEFGLSARLLPKLNINIYLLFNCSPSISIY